MSFLSDVFHGNFGNLGTDLSHDPVGTGIAAGALALGTAGLAAPAIGSLLAGGEAAGALAGGGEAAGALGIGALPGEAAAAGAAGDIALGEGGGLTSLLGGAAGDSLITGGAGDAVLGGGTGAVTGATGGIGALPTEAGVGGGLGTATDAASGGSNLFSGVGSMLGKNPLGTAVAGGGLLYSMMNANKPLPTTNAIQGAGNQAATLGQGEIVQGQSLQTYLQSGTLPPALQAQVTQQVKAAKAAAIAAAAKRGMPTDPTQNSALAQDLANIDQQALVTAGNLEANLYQAGSQSISAGANFLNMSNQDLIQLSNIQRDQQAQVGKSIAAFAAALGGGVSIGGKQGTITFNG